MFSSRLSSIKISECRIDDRCCGTANLYQRSDSHSSWMILPIEWRVDNGASFENSARFRINLVPKFFSGWKSQRSYSSSSARTTRRPQGTQNTFSWRDESVRFSPGSRLKINEKINQFLPRHSTVAMLQDLWARHSAENTELFCDCNASERETEKRGLKFAVHIGSLACNQTRPGAIGMRSKIDF